LSHKASGASVTVLITLMHLLVHCHSMQGKSSLFISQQQKNHWWFTEMN